MGQEQNSAKTFDSDLHLLKLFNGEAVYFS